MTLRIFKIAVIILSLTIIEFGYPQVNQQWVSVYDSSQTNYNSSSFIELHDSKYLYLLGTNSSDIALIKYNLSGQIIWLQRYNGLGSGNDIPGGIILDKNENIYITGNCLGENTGVDYVTIKYDSSGERIWTDNFTGTGNQRDASYDIASDKQGNIFVTGESYNEISHYRNCLTIKYDSLGNRQWISSYQRGNTWGYEIEIDGLGNAIVAGKSLGGIFVIKYNTLGDQLWVSSYNGEASPHSLRIDDALNIYVSGVITGSGGYWDYITIKYNQLGEYLWSRRNNGSANFMDQLNDMAIDVYGNVYVTGNGTQTGSGYDFTTIKYNTNGDEIWIANYNNGLNDIATSLTLDDFGNVYVTGNSDGSGSRFDYATVKYDSTGIQQWITRYNYSNEYDNEARFIAVDKYNDVYVTGVTRLNNIANSLTIKYSQTLTGISQSITETPIEFSLAQNYPNPF
ncbi:MAG: SBBP repeat-containing protein, partial [Ignavibacteriae bacterium]|nr:SBBP repeat-containing protein [Ignavibacteriota bacterium]